MKAARIARRLNLMMAEAEFDGWHRGMCREQIAKFFQAEVEKIRVELDDVAMVARRTGTPDMAREVEADIDVGWAYQKIVVLNFSRPGKPTDNPSAQAPRHRKFQQQDPR